MKIDYSDSSYKEKRITERYITEKLKRIYDDLIKQTTADIYLYDKYIEIDEVSGGIWNIVVSLCKKYDTEATIENHKIYIAENI